MDKFEKNEVQGATIEQCNNKTSKNWSYKVGEIVGLVVVACVTATIIALTSKFIFWLF